MEGKCAITRIFCPKTSDMSRKVYCPAWIDKTAGFMKTNIQTGEEQFIVGCSHQVIPFLMVEVVKASNRPAAAVESFRNEIVSGMVNLSNALPILSAPDQKRLS